MLNSVPHTVTDPEISTCKVKAIYHKYLCKNIHESLVIT